MIIGGHVSVAGGLHNAIKKGIEEEFDSLQIFVSSPRSFNVTNYSTEQKKAFVELFKEHGFKSLFFHAIYLVNLASSNDKLRNLSIESILHYLSIGSEIGAVGTVVHVGAHGGTGFESIKKILIDSMTKITDQMPDGQFLIVENSAGGGKVPSNFDEMRFIWENSDRKKVRFCLDAQHLFASGIDVSNFAIFEDFLYKFNESIGIKNLVCVHVNDSMSALGSSHDRHENIGKGQIGEEGFRNILLQPLLDGIPFILEVPGEDRKGPNKENKDKLLQIFRSISA